MSTTVIVTFLTEKDSSQNACNSSICGGNYIGEDFDVELLEVAVVKFLGIEVR